MAVQPGLCRTWSETPKTVFLMTRLICNVVPRCSLSVSSNIMITCPCDSHPLTPHFYIVKLGFTGVYIFFLIFAPKHRLWVRVRVPTIYVWSKNKNNIKIFHLKIIIFTAVKYCSILHGHVCVMVILLLGKYSRGSLPVLSVHFFADNSV